MKQTKQHAAPESPDALRAEIARLERKETEIAERAKTTATTADEADQRYIECTYQADVNDDPAAAARTEAERTVADNARREQRRAEENARRLRKELVVLRHRLEKAEQAEARAKNQHDLDTMILPAARRLDEQFGGAMAELTAVVDALYTATQRLEQVGLVDEAHRFINGRMRNLRDVFLWAQQAVKFTGRRAPRPLTHAMQGVSFEAALSGQAPARAPDPNDDTTAQIDAALAEAALEPPTLQPDPPPAAA